MDRELMNFVLSSSANKVPSYQCEYFSADGTGSLAILEASAYKKAQRHNLPQLLLFRGILHKLKTRQ